ncbi:hypothetical protein [Bacillus sp. T33-2]|uniref:hypothetical protein n=1 Tax=Bacillus sp. T33-2 TaxID=2054168 RepID=UPI0015E11D48|nr:hypothetical protein [Bacillus sp. T33-2]
MAERKSKNPTGNLHNENNDMDGGPIGGRLNSDDSFSDTGLNNARLTREAVIGEKTDH